VGEGVSFSLNLVAIFYGNKLALRDEKLANNE
jgi:hypothetical protein